VIGAELAHRGARHRDETGRIATRRDAGWGTGGAPASEAPEPLKPGLNPGAGGRWDGPRGASASAPV